MGNVLIINSSPRKNSNSRALSERVAAAAANNGHEVRTVDVGRAKIHPCTGCETCHGKTPGKCVFDDDMTEMYAHLDWAGIIVFSSPIYYFTVNAQMKLFLDRCYAVGVEAFKDKRVAGVFVYGDVDPVKSGCVNAIRMFQDICAYIPAKWVGAVYGTAMEEGEAVKDEELLKAAEEFGAAL